MSTSEITAYNYGQRVAREQPDLAAVCWQHDLIPPGNGEVEVQQAFVRLGPVRFQQFFRQGLSAGSQWPA